MMQEDAANTTTTTLYAFEQHREEVAAIVNRELPRILKESSEQQHDFDESFQTLLHSLGIEKLTEAKEAPMQFRVVDHLCQCRIIPEGEGEDSRFFFPLEIFDQPHMNMFFVKKKAPNAFIFLDHRSPTAIFTKRGFLTLAGGSNDREIVTSMLLCCFKILHILRCFYPTMKFFPSLFRIHNKVAVAHILMHRINLPALVDHFRSRGLMTIQYQEELINFCFIKRLLPSRPSITFCVSASGGVNILGFRYDNESRKAVQLLYHLLRENPRVLVKRGEPTPENIAAYKRLQRAKAKREAEKKQKKKIKINERWRADALAQQQEREKAKLDKDLVISAAATYTAESTSECRPASPSSCASDLDIDLDCGGVPLVDLDDL